MNLKHLAQVNFSLQVIRSHQFRVKASQELGQTFVCDCTYINTSSQARVHTCGLPFNISFNYSALLCFSLGCSELICLFFGRFNPEWLWCLRLFVVNGTEPKFTSCVTLPLPPFISPTVLSLQSSPWLLFRSCCFFYSCLPLFLFLLFFLACCSLIISSSFMFTVSSLYLLLRATESSWPSTNFFLRPPFNSAMWMMQITRHSLLNITGITYRTTKLMNRFPGWRMSLPI